MKYNISIDVMGGDFAPKAVLAGLNHYCAHYDISDLHFLLFGKEKEIKPFIEKCKYIKNYEIINCDDVVLADAKPSKVIRQSSKTSMWQAINSVKTGKSQAVLSSGNTGCYMAFSALQLRTIEGLKRPALTTMLPTSKTKAVTMLDLGANTECTAQTLKNFAVMGSLYYRILHPNQKDIKVGLLNIGEEESKGISLIQDAHTLLKDVETDLFTYTGFVEGNDIMKGEVDVVVTDGFTGNVALKTIEGVGIFIKHLLTNVFKSSILTKLAYLMIKSKLKRFAKRIDPSNYNGAVLAGVNGIVVKSHGSSKKNGIFKAIEYTVNLTRNEFSEKLKNALKENK